MMKTVYEQSSCVLSWLGPPSVTTNSSLAFDLIEDFWRLFGATIEKTAHALSPKCLSTKGALARLLRWSKSDRGLSAYSEKKLGITIKKRDIAHLLSSCSDFKELSQVPHFSAKIDALCELLRRSYWTRKWILQEVSAAGECLLLCGNHATYALTFFLVYALLKFRVDMDIERGMCLQGDVDEYVEKLLLVKHSVNMHDFHNFWLFTNNTDIDCLLDILYLTRNLSATDPRDKIYALLSSCDPEEIGRLGIMPDYSKMTTVSKIITTVSERYISSGQENRGYSLEYANGILSRHDIPSWCFDFTMEGLKQPGSGSKSFPVMKHGFGNATLLRDHGDLLLVVNAIFLGVIRETSNIQYPDAVSSHDSHWSTSGRDRFLENQIPLFLDWIEGSSKFSSLAIPDLCELLGELLELLARNIGHLEMMADAVDVLMHPLYADDVAFQLTLLVTLLFSLFSSLGQNYYRWQLACLEQDAGLLGTRDAERVVSTSCLHSAANDAKVATIIGARHTEVGMSTGTKTASTYLSDGADDLSQRSLSRTLQASHDSGKQVHNSVQSATLVRNNTKLGWEDSSNRPRQTEMPHSIPFSLSNKEKPGVWKYNLGVVHTQTEIGDHVFTDCSGQVTFILRSQSRMVGDCVIYKLVGKCEFSGVLTEESHLSSALRAGTPVKLALT